MGSQIHDHEQLSQEKLVDKNISPDHFHEDDDYTGDNLLSRRRSKKLIILLLLFDLFTVSSILWSSLLNILLNRLMVCNNFTLNFK